MVAYTGNEADTYSVKERISRDADFDDDSRLVWTFRFLETELYYETSC